MFRDLRLHVLILFACSATVALWCLPACADGLFYQLPTDGTSATYELAATMKSDAREMKLTGTLKISSVGRTTVAGEPARWIEIASFNSGEKKTRYVKFLILEKHLQRETKAADHLLELWTQGGSKPRQRDTDQLTGESESIAAYFAGKLNDAKKLPAIQVESVLGKLLCTGHSGNVSYQVAKVTNDVQYVSRIHRSAPFGYVQGTVAVHQHVSGETRARLDFEFKLIETAADAKSMVNPAAVSPNPVTVRETTNER